MPRAASVGEEAAEAGRGLGGGSDAGGREGEAAIGAAIRRTWRSPPGDVSAGEITGQASAGGSSTAGRQGCRNGNALMIALESIAPKPW